MKFSEQWLRTLVDPPLTSAALADALTMAGVEVEKREPAAPPLHGVVVARIDTVLPHPNADRLRVCRVDDGSGQPLSIVCGAPNAAAGMRAPLARIGATLPGGLSIRETEVRGVRSEGMLCSPKELGLADGASGLMQLPDDAVPGTDLRDALALDDTLITLKLTPNRADCLSLYGIAREVAAITGAPLMAPPLEPVVVTSRTTHRVRVENAAACPRFASRVIEGVNPNALTPAWMRQRLERSGVRSIASLVDITNYVMLELGQPLHAYDRALLRGDIVVRFAREGETLLLLNGETLKLDRDLLLVCDEEKPLGLAGIMGGEHSGIGSGTANVVLEGAFWSPGVIAGRMRRLGFMSDAGYRFERGVDFELAPVGVERATALMLSICGGRAGPLSDVKGPLPTREPIRVRTSRIRRLLGLELSANDIADVFARLKFAFSRNGDDAFLVVPPSYRFDLTIEEDFVEEVARIHGFDAIPPAIGKHRAQMLHSEERVRPLPALRQRLVARDWQEVITFSFVDSAIEATLDPSGTPIKLQNPIAAQRDVMRRTLLPGLIETLKLNLARREPRIRVFEIGRVYRDARATTQAQPLRVGGLAFGDALPEQWGVPARAVDLFDVKGDLEAVAHPLRLTTQRAQWPFLHPGRSARVAIEGKDTGWIGELHPRLVRQFELAQAPVVYEIDLAPLLDQPVPAAQHVSRQPVARRDIAIVVDEAVSAQAVLDELQLHKPPHVEALRIFDTYRGGGLPPGRKSLAILVLMQDTARTLTDAELEATVADIVSLLRQRFGATLRT